MAAPGEVPRSLQPGFPSLWIIWTHRTSSNRLDCSGSAPGGCECLNAPQGRNQSVMLVQKYLKAEPLSGNLERYSSRWEWGGRKVLTHIYTQHILPCNISQVIAYSCATMSAWIPLMYAARAFRQSVLPLFQLSYLFKQRVTWTLWWGFCLHVVSFEQILVHDCTFVMERVTQFPLHLLSLLSRSTDCEYVCLHVGGWATCVLALKCVNGFI